MSAAILSKWRRNFVSPYRGRWPKREDKKLETSYTSGAVLAVAMLLGTPAGAAPSSYPPMTVALAYDVYFGGAHVGGMQVKVGLAPRAYNMQMQARTVGLVDRLFPWRMQAKSHGELTQGVLMKPLQAEHGNIWRGKKRYLTLVYDGERIKVTRAKPGPAKDVGKDVPDALRRDTVDMTGAILRVALSMRGGGNCAHRVPIFNGRRRFDLIMSHEKTDLLKASRYSPFDGKAENCKVWVKRIGKKKRRYDHDDHNTEGSAGYGQDRGKGWRDRDRHGFVWIGRVFEGAPPMPVRVRVDTRFGVLMGHLRVAEMQRGGEKKRLARGR